MMAYIVDGCDIRTILNQRVCIKFCVKLGKCRYRGARNETGLLVYLLQVEYKGLFQNGVWKNPRVISWWRAFWATNHRQISRKYGRKLMKSFSKHSRQTIQSRRILYFPSIFNNFSDVTFVNFITYKKIHENDIERNFVPFAIRLF